MPFDVNTSTRLKTMVTSDFGGRRSITVSSQARWPKIRVYNACCMDVPSGDYQKLGDNLCNYGNYSNIPTD